MRQVIIDTDPGIDDAVAILFALSSPAFDVRGITTVAGNIGLGVTTRNAGRLLALMERRDIPVHAGAAGPLGQSAVSALDIHGNDGLGGVALPEPAAPAGQDAVGWMARTLRAAEAGTVDILALGPLTNLAALLRSDPGAARRAGRVIAMGGAIDEPGNVGPRSEFNMAADPLAAQEVLAAGLPLTLVPLDVTRRVRATKAYTAALAGSGRAGARAAGALIDAYFQRTEGRESRPLHDPCVMLLAEAGHLFGIERMGLSVAVAAGEDPGALGSGPAAVDVAMRVDAEGALALLAARLMG